MDLTKEFVAFAQLGATWVLWVLVLLSVLSIGVMIDRALWFRNRIIDTEQLVRELRGAFARDEIERFETKYRDVPAVAAQIALAGLAERKRGADVVAEAMQGERVRWRSAADRHLIVLGTLGNNVPFIGLFGTVLGVVDAFEHLRQHTAAAEDETLDLIARALAATAFGLLVAIPAVIAYNYFTRRRGAMLASADECAHAMLALVRGEPEPAPAPAAKGDGDGGK
jgi:biopolymer transport protein ExbB